MVRLLVGHRGSGKSTFIRRSAELAHQLGVPFTGLDLDTEIENVLGEKLAQAFTRIGEARFRQLEKEILARLIAEARGATFIAVGAGFEGPPPREVEVLWLRRSTDALGRCFLDRPRLNAELSPFEEYKERWVEREVRFRAWAHQEVHVPEGEITMAGERSFEAQILGWGPLHLPYALTVLPENFKDWDRFVARRAKWDVRVWELRDDLLDDDQIVRASNSLSPERVLFSRRRQEAFHRQHQVRVDWALELGAPPGSVYSLSLHEREDQVDDSIAHLMRQGSRAEHLKLAIEIQDFGELLEGHRWWQEDPLHRSFLPRSNEGRWRWYRSLYGPQMPLHFVREGCGSALDQPTLWQSLHQVPFKQSFAAVLGHPVEHSRTPVEHLPFFAQQNRPVVAVDVEESEFTTALEVLRELGLTHAAVTSPLKKLAWASAHSVTPEARRAQAANTLLVQDGRITAHNTDILALADLAREVSTGDSEVWLWGGGGMKTSVKAAWPNLREISARVGCEEVTTASPGLVIWATGRSRPFRWPPESVRPELILDLNYGADSPGLEWAVRSGCAYQSGLRLFELQARYQRQFWQECTT